MTLIPWRIENEKILSEKDEREKMFTGGAQHCRTLSSFDQRNIGHAKVRSVATNLRVVTVNLKLYLVRMMCI